MTIGALYKKLRTDICDYGGKGVNTGTKVTCLLIM